MSTTVFSGMDITLVNDFGQAFNPIVFCNVNDSWLIFYDRLTKKPVAKTYLDSVYKNVFDKVKKRSCNFSKDKFSFDI